MFRVNRSENCLDRLTEPGFSDLNIREREHLQEWLAGRPDALGEDLLIIQKEFDGFADTRERLDLLALDTEGRLVVVENKLDDSGRDVDWQALKYVAYRSSLKKADIIEIYQKYLDRWFEGEKAVENLCEFLDVEELEETVLNPGNEQRLVLIAANFRKEVTATVLWLLGHGVRAQCFRVAPYSFDKELFIDLQQIIPIPEAEDYMIGMAVKDSEEKSAQGAQRRSGVLQQKFWSQTLDALREHNVSRFQNISPSKDHWLNGATGVSDCTYTMNFLKKGVRVELYLRRPDAAQNKWIFDELERDKQEIEDRFGSELNWQRLDGKNGKKRKACRISYSCAFDGHNAENWREMITWLCRHIVRLEEAFSDPMGRLNQQLKSNSDMIVGAVNPPQSTQEA